MIVKLAMDTDDTINSQAYGVLRRNLMSGYFKPGQSVSIRYLAETLGVSATPAREAIKRLQAEHALVIGPNRTPTVPVLSHEDLRELRDIRLALEGMATERAAGKMSAATLALVKKYHDNMADATASNDSNAYLENNWQFHRTIYQAADSDYMMGIIENLWLRTGPQVRLTFFEKSSRSNSMVHHLRAYEAIERKDGVAARIAIEADIAGAASDIESALP